MPQTKPVEKPVMSQDQILKLIGGIQDVHDLCLIYIGIFCGPRASGVLGLQWQSWAGTTLVPHGTAFEGRFYPGRLKNQSSRAPIGVPEQVRPIIEAWKKMSPDSSPDALMFPTFGRGGAEGTGGAALGKEFPPAEGSSNRQEAEDPGKPHHISGDEADTRNQSPAPKARSRMLKGRYATRASRRLEMSTCRRSRRVS